MLFFVFELGAHARQTNGRSQALPWGLKAPLIFLARQINFCTLCNMGRIESK